MSFEKFAVSCYVYYHPYRPWAKVPLDGMRAGLVQLDMQKGIAEPGA